MRLQLTIQVGLVSLQYPVFRPENPIKYRVSSSVGSSNRYSIATCPNSPPCNEAPAAAPRNRYRHDASSIAVVLVCIHRRLDRRIYHHRAGAGRPDDRPGFRSRRAECVCSSRRPSIDPVLDRPLMERRCGFLPNAGAVRDLTPINSNSWWRCAICSLWPFGRPASRESLGLVPSDGLQPLRPGPARRYARHVCLQGVFFRREYP